MRVQKWDNVMNGGSRVVQAHAVRTLPGVALWFCATLTVFASGCVTFYQPLSGLQEPVAIDPQAPNFPGMKVLVRCAPDEAVESRGAEVLCKRVKTLFTTQGAVVETDVPKPGRGLLGVKAPVYDLVIDLHSRLVHQDSSTVQTLFSVVTLTLLPMIYDYTIAQDVKIRDAEGFLLASETLEARFEQYFGFGVWLTQSLLDLFLRSPAEKLTGDAPKKDFSRDLYAQLSQLLLRASLRSKVLHQFDSGAAAAKATK